MVILSLSGNYTKTSSDEDRFYIVGDTGLEIINKQSGLSVGFLAFSGGFTSVWAEDDGFVFLGSSSGLYSFPKPANFGLGYDFSNQLAYDSRSEDLLSEDIFAVDGITRDYLVVASASGVDVFIKGSGHFQGTALFPVTSLKVVSNGDIIYGGNFGIAFKDSPINAGWTTPDNLVVEPVLPSSSVTDLDAEFNDGELFVAVTTISGVLLTNKKTPFAISPIIKLFI